MCLPLQPCSLAWAAEPQVTVRTYVWHVMGSWWVRLELSYLASRERSLSWSWSEVLSQGTSGKPMQQRCYWHHTPMFLFFFLNWRFSHNVFLLCFLLPSSYQSLLIPLSTQPHVSFSIFPQTNKTKTQETHSHTPTKTEIKINKQKTDKMKNMPNETKGYHMHTRYMYEHVCVCPVTLGSMACPKVC